MNPPEEPAALPGALLAADRPCLQCGYNLRGLPITGQCPECSAPVARSLQGNLLKFSSSEYVSLLHRGVFLVQAAIITQVCMMVAAFLGVAALGAAGAPGANAPPSWFDPALTLVGTAASIASLVGWWLLSSPDPAYVGSSDGTTARKVVRVAVIINAAAAVLPLLFGNANLQALLRGGTLTAAAALALVVTLASMIAWVVWFFAAMRYLRWLAPRLPNQKVHDRARTLTWLGPILYTVGALLCGLGPLVALILYYNLLDWVRKDLKAIRQAVERPA